MKIKANKGVGASGLKLKAGESYDVGDEKGQVSPRDARYLVVTGAASPVDDEAKTATKRSKGVSKENSGLA